MTKVIQIRGVPDETHARLVEAAGRAGKSLTAYLSDELEVVARRGDPAGHNRRVIERLRSEIGTIAVSDEVVARTVREGREARTRDLVERHRMRPE
jgi:hypothetical protein